MFYNKTVERLNKERFLNTQQGFLIHTPPHLVCHRHRTVFSSALVRNVAQVEKHWSVL